MTQAPGFIEHPQRPEIVGEMHLRRFPAFELPAQVIQLVRTVDQSQSSDEQLSLAALPDLCGITGERHREGRWSSDVRASWERHSEASTITVTMTGAVAQRIGWRRPDSIDGAAALEWAETAPGYVIRATRIIVVASDEAAGPFVETADFTQSHLVSCHVADGARIWSDFRIHKDGYGRIVIAANGLPPVELASCVQRLQELGNYRNLALLGLPVARTTWARLDEIERALAETGQALLNGDQRDDDLLTALTTHSEELLSITAETEFRMSATAAYAVIVADRLRELKAQPVKGFQSLTDFTSRRFNPAKRTCAAVSQRLALLNGRAGQFTSLLRTRIETNIENQNGRLLASMDRSIRMQLRLQHLVEGLSAVAISYYLLGLITYPIKAAEHVWGGFSPTSLLGVAAPLIVLAVWVALQIMRQRLFREDDQALRLAKPHRGR
ncbi:DUF3422 domain-containing protein [Sphingosinicella sp.]|uniref:DUF3422 domain-containing protein n=1 Tax=Sphingosinicella sp. TaxID=1917971 RepID=UPI0017A54E86|nr:DUF3422 domain-containing protein [Sphingosinicella sp.]MBA4759991.1 DUF3422 domain-containing protein [Sphingosinicella sp.]